MIIAGLTGGIGHGKTTFAGLLAAQSNSADHFETWELVAEVANALRSENNFHPSSEDTDELNQWLFILPEIVNEHMHVNLPFGLLRLTPERLTAEPENYRKLYEYLHLMQSNPELISAEITEVNKAAFRPFLQWLGGYLVVNGGSGIWYDEIIRRIAHSRNSGCDLVTVGGVRYPADAERLRNAGGVILEISRPSLPLQDLGDITERERDAIVADGEIINNGSLEDLTACAVVVYKDISMRQLQRNYAALGQQK